MSLLYQFVAVTLLVAFAVASLPCTDTSGCASPGTKSAGTLWLQLNSRAGRSADGDFTEPPDDISISSLQKLQNSTKVIDALVHGVEGIHSVVPLLQVKPAKIDEAVASLGKQLFAALGHVLEGSDAKLPSTWTQDFQSLLLSNPTIGINLQDYSRTGKVDSLSQGLSSLLSAAALHFTSSLSANTALPCGRFLKGLQGLVFDFNGVWQQHFQGDTEAAIQGFKRAVNRCMLAVTVSPKSNALLLETTEQNATSNAIKQALTALDSVASNLTSTVMSYQRHIIAGRVCWKHTQEQDRKLPSVCPADYIWDGAWTCNSKPIVDGSTTRKGPSTLSQCDVTSDYNTRQNGWCFAKCPQGTKTNNAGSCTTQCGGPFPAEGTSLCGTDPNAISQAVAQMVISTFTTAFSFVTMNPMAITSSLINNGRAFAYSRCPDDLATADLSG
jgi:hypothetical protein